MSEHTKEPWACNHQGWCSNTELFENQRRIVACVNACQRLNTDLLERVTKNGRFGIHPRPQERIEELEQQCNDYKARALMYEAANAEQGKLLNEVIKERDELLAALEKLVEVYDAMSAPRGPSRIMADAALAKSKP